MSVARLFKQVRADDWIYSALENLDDRQYVEKWREPDLAIHPSSLGQDCILAYEWKMLGHKGANRLQSVRRMDNGSAAHLRWAAEFEAAGILHAAEVQVRCEDPKIVGSLDFALRQPLNGKLCLLELKTTKESFFNSLRFTGDRQTNMRIVYNWRKSYALQVATYLEHGRVDGERFHEAAFLFENTNDQTFKLAYVEPDEDMKHEALQYARAAQELLKKGELNARPYTRDSRACKWCNHLALCNRYEDGDEETHEEIKRRIDAIRVDS